MGLIKGWRCGIGIVALLAACSGRGVPSALRVEGFSRQSDGWSARGELYAARVSSDGALEIRGTAGATLRVRTVGVARGSAVETLHASPTGVEQSWRFAARPPGAGALDVRVRVDGQRYVRAAADGIHFEDPSGRGRIGARYGAATWVDAAGARTPIAMRFDAGEITLRVPGDVVERSRYPAVLDPAISPELSADQPVLGPTRLAARPAVAFDGTNFLVVWTDYRGNSDRALAATRVSTSGEVLDTSNITLNKGPSAAPALAFGGGSYLVAWEDDNGHDVYMRRVGTDGKPIGTAATRVWAADFYDEFDPAVAFDGTNFVVTLRSRSSQGRNYLVAARVSPTGTLLDTAPRMILEQAPGSSLDDLVGTKVAFDGANYQLVWQQTLNGNKVVSYKVTPDIGIYVNSMRTLSPAAAYGAVRPALAFGAAEHLVVWAETTSASDITPAIRGARLDPAGTVAEPITIAAAAAGQASPAVAWDGTNWLVTWAAGTGATGAIRAARVSAAGALVDQTPFVISGVAGTKATPAVACGGGACYGAWADTRVADPNIYGTRIAAGAAADPSASLLSRFYNGERDAAAASNGSDYLVVWSDTRAGSTQIFGTRVNAQGTSLDAPAFSVGEGHTEAQTYPSVASDGSGYLVTWYESAGMRIGARLIAASGARGPILAFPFDGYKPSAAFAGNVYLVAWTDNDPAATSQYDTYAARVDKNGQLLDTTALRFTNPSQNDFDARVATDGTNFFVVWHDFTTVFAVRVTPAGAILDNPPLTIRPADVTRQQQPTVAFDGTNYLVVWEDMSNALRGTRVGKDGVVLDAITALRFTTSSSTYDSTPSLSWDGTSYLLGFQRDTYSTSGSTYETSARLFALNPAGTLLRSYSATCVGCSSALVNPSLAAGNGHALMAFTRTESSTGFALNRARMFMYTETPVMGTPCTSTAECGGATCVDGVCCNSACGGGAKDCQACSIAAGARANGTCDLVTAGLACTLTGGAGMCTAAGACVAAPPDGGATDAATTVDGGVDGPRVDAPVDTSMDRQPSQDGGVDQAIPVDAGGGGDLGGSDEGGVDTGAGGDAGPAADAGQGGADAGKDAAPPVMDAATGGGDAGPKPPSSSGCGCDTGGGGGSPAALLVLGATIMFGIRRRRRGRGSVLALAVAGALAVSGCGPSSAKPDAGGTGVGGTGGTGVGGAGGAGDTGVGAAGEGGAGVGGTGASAGTGGAGGTGVGSSGRGGTGASAGTGGVGGTGVGGGGRGGAGAAGTGGTGGAGTGGRGGSSQDAGMDAPVTTDAGDPGPKPPGSICSTDGRWCWMNPHPQGQTLTTAWGGSANDIWVGGYNRTSLRWNGSAFSQYLLSGSGINDIAGRAANDIWAVGNSGVILRWQGSAWLSQGRIAWSDSFFADSVVLSVWPIAANDVWFGAGFGVAHYDGTKITPLVENINTIWGNFYGIWGAASNDVWMAGTLSGTDARFAHWDGTQLTFTTMTGMNRLNAIRGASATDIWAVGVGGTALHWDGQAWTNRPVPGGATLQSVWVRTGSDVWAVGDNGVAFHWDGQAWSETPTGETNGLQVVWGSAANDVWAFGNYGATLHWNGSSWERRWRGTIASWNTVWGADQNDIWIAGASGAGLRWDGTMLRDAPFPTTINNLHGTARDDVWAVGATGILHYDGNAWAPATGCGAGMYMGSVRALSRSNVWASGGATLCHFDGNAWTPVNSGLARIVDIAPVGSDDVFIIDDRRVMRLAGGVLNTLVTDSSSVYFHSIFAVSPTDVWVNGYNGNGMYRHYNGTSWSSTTTTGAYSDYLYASGPTDVWSVGQYATVSQRATGGITVDTSPLSTGAEFNGVWSNGAGTVWVVGGEGTIWRRWP